MTDVGVLIAKSGGGAQGDNIRCYNCYFNGFTGRAGRSAAITRAGTPGAATPRMQSKSRLSAEIFKDVHSTAWLSTAVALRLTAPRWRMIPAGFGTQTGFDVYCEAPQDRCIVRSVRSESHKLAAGNPILVEHSRTIFQAATVVPRWPEPVVGGHFMAGGKQSSRAQGKAETESIIRSKRPGRFGGLGLTWLPAAVRLRSVTPAANWANNAFAGQQATIVFGGGNGEYCVVASNTATTITCAAGWRTNYYQLRSSILTCPVNLWLSPTGPRIRPRAGR